MVVSRQQLEACLEGLLSDVSLPHAGLFGPGSIVWQVDRESVVFLASGRAALLQLAHPAVASAIIQHSKTVADPAGRFARTFEQVFAMVFGDAETACRSARRVHRIHEHIVGDLEEELALGKAHVSYHANDPASLIWVYATLFDSALMSYELVLGPLTVTERERYYQESRRFMLLFGVSERQMPADYAEFRRYFEATLHGGGLVIGNKTREVAGFLFRAPRGPRTPVFRWLEVMTTGLLPENLRGEYRLPWGARERRIYTMSLILLRSFYPRLPLRLRALPAYERAKARLKGRPPSRMGLALERWVFAAAGVRQ